MGGFAEATIIDSHGNTLYHLKKAAEDNTTENQEILAASGRKLEELTKRNFSLFSNWLHIKRITPINGSAYIDKNTYQKLVQVVRTYDAAEYLGATTSTICALVSKGILKKHNFSNQKNTYIIGAQIRDPQVLMAIHLDPLMASDKLLQCTRTEYKDPEFYTLNEDYDNVETTYLFKKMYSTKPCLDSAKYVYNALLVRSDPALCKTQSVALSENKIRMIISLFNLDEEQVARKLKVLKTAIDTEIFNPETINIINNANFRFRINYIKDKWNSLKDSKKPYKPIEENDEF